MPITRPDLLRRQTGYSESYRDPLAEVDWRQLGTGFYWLPEPALSLHGVPEFDTLPTELKQRLSHYEFLSTVQYLAWLDGLFLRQIARLLQSTLATDLNRYALHALREKAGRKLVWLQATEMSGLPEVSSIPRRSAPYTRVLSRLSPPGSAVFWLIIVMFEEVADRLCRYIRSFEQQLHPVVNQIFSLHVMIEAQHLVFASSRLEEELEKRGLIGRALLTDLGNFVVPEITNALYFPRARVYRLAGLPQGLAWSRLARNNRARIGLVKEGIANTLRAIKYYRRSHTA
jgi:hypothetical protein